VDTVKKSVQQNLSPNAFKAKKLLRDKKRDIHLIMKDVESKKKGQVADSMETIGGKSQGL